MKKIGLSFRLALYASFLIATLFKFTTPAQANHQSLSENTNSILNGIDASVVKEFQRAWKLSGCGVTRFEYLILLFRTPDGSISAQSKGISKELAEFKFTWTPGIIAVVHTHPNGDDAQPSLNDLRVADRFQVPMFTITRSGMYVYDPFTRKTVEVQQGLNWLELSKWQAVEASLAKSK